MGAGSRLCQPMSPYRSYLLRLCHWHRSVRGMGAHPPSTSAWLDPALLPAQPPELQEVGAFGLPRMALDVLSVKKSLLSRKARLVAFNGCPVQIRSKDIG